jgi:hypothetical protein
MNRKKWTIYSTIAAAVVVASLTAPALADETPDELRVRADRMEMDQSRAEYTKMMIKDVLADAEYRTALMQKDSPITLDFSGFAIIRWDYNNGGGVAQTNEFNIPYARLEFSGRVLDKVGYVVSGEFSDYDNGSFDLVDAYVTLDLPASFDLKAGQFVTSFYNGYTDSPLDQVAGEYSVLATTFGQGRSQGLEVSRNFGILDLSASYNDGFDSSNEFVTDNDYGVSVRADLDFGGGFRAGAAYAYQSEIEDYGTFTVDAGWANDGWDLGVSYVSADYIDGGYGENYGINAIVAYQCLENLQGFVQYQNGKLASATSDLNLFEVGANYDIVEGVRWTTTFGYAFDGVDASWDLGRSGWNTGDSDGQYLLRTQLSVQF